MGYVYILKSLKNNRYYIGSTNDIDRRLSEHYHGKSVYTKFHLPLVLMFQQAYQTLQEARSVEKWLKKQKDRKLIDRIISERKIKKILWNR